ncbi:hypothetical protein DFS34DRAFT_649493 [Phlyctochytrium arcticum]|nr:hypothetical protein DFS34DRAFT_649493 [Phlyctochytrium arcticum]
MARYGHATRATVVICELLSRGHSLIIITSAPATLFSSLLKSYPTTCHLRPPSQILDPGVVQEDAVTVDGEATLKELRVFFGEGVEGLISEEEQWMRNERVDVVCLDASFLPAVAAKRQGIPSLLITNFTFDAIFAALVKSSTDRQLVLRVESMYACADWLLRLPGWIDMPGFLSSDAYVDIIGIPRSVSLPGLKTEQYQMARAQLANGINEEEKTIKSAEKNERIVDVPLVARLAQRSREAVRQELGISNTTRVMLITFGGFQLDQRQYSPPPDPSSPINSVRSSDKHPLASAIPPGWIALIPAPSTKAPGPTATNIITIPAETSYLPDYLHAADLILGKCGYGTCSEAVAHHKPFVYVSRLGFAEEEGLLQRLMRVHLGPAVVEMGREAFFGGQWEESVEAAWRGGILAAESKCATAAGGERTIVRIVEDVAAGATSLT